MTLLKTDRLILKEICTEDQAFIYQLLNSPGWLEHIGDRNIQSLKDAENYIKDSFIKSYQKHGFGLYKMELKDQGVPIGVCGLLKRKHIKNIDIGYAILPEYEGKGYTFEAAEIILKFAKTTMGCKTVLAFTTEENLASQNLLKKLGFTFQEIKELEDFEGKNAIYSIRF